MAQRPKAEVRARIVEAAASAFAADGYGGTTIGAVAARAGVSTGNVYRYFEGKEQLFAAALPASFAADLRARTRDKVKALGAVRDLRLLAKDARYHVLSGELLDYCLANRARVIILLARAEGTEFARFAGEFRDALVEWALEYVRVAWPTVVATPALRFALDEIYARFLGAMATALTELADDGAVREAVFHLTSHHQGGLKHLFELAARGGDHESRDDASRTTDGGSPPRAHSRGARSPGADPVPGAAGPRAADRGGRPGGRR